MTLGPSSGSVGISVVAAVLVAAVLHAVWNAQVHAIGDELVGFALMGTAVTVGAAAIVLGAPAPDRASWPFLAGSAVLHVAYNLLLMRCYRVGEFSQVYPLARGTSPWLVALGAAALLTGVAIAGYTTVDGLGVRHAGSVACYTGWLVLLQSPVLPLAALSILRGRLWGELRPHLLSGLSGGLLSLAAYGLVLWAQTRGALAPIAALRETSVNGGRPRAAARIC